MSRSASAAPRSPATVVKRANISVCLPTLEKIAARVYLVMSLVTVKVPKAPEPLACMRRSGITSRTKLASFSLSHTSCDSSGPRGPAVRLFWLSGPGASKWVGRWVGLGLSAGLRTALAPGVVANHQARPDAQKGEIERNEQRDSHKLSRIVCRPSRHSPSPWSGGSRELLIFGVIWNSSRLPPLLQRFTAMRREPALPGSAAAAAEQAATHLQQVADAQLAIAVLVEHRPEQAAAEATLLADLLLFLAEDVAEHVRIRTRGARLGAAALLEHAFRQVRHHDRGEDLQQLPGLAALQARGLGDAGLCAFLLPAEDVAEDAGAVGLPVLRAAEHRTQHAAEIGAAGMVVLQRTEQRLRAFRLAGVAAQRAHQQGQ